MKGLRGIVFHLSVTIQFSIFCERALATFCVHNYEKHSVLFGFMFCTLAGVLIAVILFTTYRHKDFDELTASMLNTPTAAAPRINRMFIILGAMSVAAIVGMQILLRINRRKSSKCKTYPIPHFRAIRQRATGKTRGEGFAPLPISDPMHPLAQSWQQAGGGMH
ncbi:unnamed protein product [Heligmosomoides polygyrus]|uniref:Uncharacterized protein n=1 Tax=Heligmosomoides polygyrus TaxID=6339 RepID=A0A3P8A170_HELPZ|nr:unnamed protein product [Heligmosomoides polygyrus]